MKANITSVKISWAYSPENFFEADFEVRQDHHTIAVSRGQFDVIVDGDLHRDDAEIRADVERELISLLDGAQLDAVVPYKLELRKFSPVAANGAEGVTMFVEPIVIKMSAGSVDVEIVGADGTIIRSSKEDRAERRHDLSLRALRHSKDLTLETMLASFGDALNHPDQTLWHLYEIRDALQSKFGGESSAKATLGLSKSVWESIGKFANAQPLKGGRHQGKYISSQLSELSDAKKALLLANGRTMIDAYLDYLDRELQSKGLP
jgi:hypothetical protein